VLAYVFRHWMRAGVDSADYEAALREFHARLQEAAPDGFEGSASVRYPDGGYADWYLLAGSFALDPLNDAAVSGLRRPAHDRAAAGAERGEGTLYRLHSGRPDLKALREVRLAKPSGRPYADFYTRLEPLLRRPDVSLWRRQMTLGPPPEFCLLSAEPVEVPAEMEPADFPRHPV